MDNGGKNEAFFTGLLNKTRKDKIFIVILAGILMMVIAMPTKSSSAKSYTTGPVISTGSEDYEKNLGEELQQMLENTDGVGKVKVLVKTNDTKEVTGVLVVCEGGDFFGGSFEKSKKESYYNYGTCYNDRCCRVY